MSPFTQYFMRKLLRRYLTQSQLPLRDIPVADPDLSDLSQVLRSVCQSEQEFNVRLYELESLIEQHSRLNAHEARYAPATVKDEAAKIEARIQQLFELRLVNLLPKRLPPMLPEMQGQKFQFCIQDQLQSGIYYQKRFYGLIKQWPRGAALRTHQVAWILAQQEIPCIITQSAQTYSLWLNLKSPKAIRLLQQGDTLLNLLLKISPIVHRRQAISHRSLWHS